MGYIPTNVISITDGQIFLETDPSIRVFDRHISRAPLYGSAAQIKAIKKVASVKLQLAQFRELAAFSQIESDLDEKTKATLERGARIVEVFKQPAYSPIPVEIQVAIMWAVQNDYIDSIDTEKVSDAVVSIREYFTSSATEVAAKILKEKAITEDVEGDLRKAVEDWKRGFAGNPPSKTVSAKADH